MNPFTVFLIVLLVLILLVGCSSPPVVEQVKKREPKIVGENISPEKRACILNALEFLPRAVRQSLEEAHLRGDIGHFKYLYLEETRHASGHNCPYGGRKICLRPEFVGYKLVWHEVAHVYTLTLKDSKKFLEEWAKIAGDVYAPNYEDYRWIGASEGLLTWYSRKNVIEDIAEWVEESLNYLYLDRQSPVFNNGHFKTEKRYRRKLDCLRKYGLINKSDYKKLKPLFE